MSRKALSIITGIILITSGCSRSTSSVTKNNYGSFVGKVRTEWLDGDTREMRLLENFGYQDPKGKLWVAPTDSVVDGASIPKAFWSFIGGPFEGVYRNASVIHDVACEKKLEPWQDVHRMFYEACLCGGVDPKKASLMYAAVYHFGPRWKIVVGSAGYGRPTHESVSLKVDAPTQRQVQELGNFFKSNNLTPSEIENLDVSRLDHK